MTGPLINALPSSDSTRPPHRTDAVPTHEVDAAAQAAARQWRGRASRNSALAAVPLEWIGLPVDTVTLRWRNGTPVGSLASCDYFFAANAAAVAVLDRDHLILFYMAAPGQSGLFDVAVRCRRGHWQLTTLLDLHDDDLVMLLHVLSSTVDRLPRCRRNSCVVMDGLPQPVSGTQAGETQRKTAGGAVVSAPEDRRS